MSIDTFTMIQIAFITGFALFSLLGAIRTARRNRKLAREAVESGIAPIIPLDPRGLEMERSFSTRSLKPFLSKLQRFGRKLTPSGNIEKLQRQLLIAGHPKGLTITDFLGLRFLAGAGIGIGAFVVATARTDFSMAVLIAVAGFIIGLNFPDYWLKQQVKTRQKAIALALPDALDMMSICVDAGLGFEAALQKVGDRWEDALALEFQRVVSDTRVGMRRGTALRNMVERTDVAEIASFVAVLIQADKLGIGIRDVLHTQSVQMRIRRRQRAEEEARKAPLKMLFPLVFFIMPAIFAIVLGPAVPLLMRSLGSL